MLDVSDRAFDIADEFSAVAALQFSDLCLVIEDGILKDLLYVFVAYFRWFLAWGSQMLPSVDSQIDLGIAEIFRFVV